MINNRRNIQVAGYNQPTLLSKPNSNQLLRAGQKMSPNLKVQGGFLSAQYERKEIKKPMKSPLRSLASSLKVRNKYTAGNVSSTKGTHNVAHPTERYSRGMGKSLNRSGSMNTRGSAIGGR